MKEGLFLFDQALQDQTKELGLEPGFKRSLHHRTRVAGVAIVPAY